jgi:hypothetical protein
VGVRNLKLVRHKRSTTRTPQPKDDNENEDNKRGDYIGPISFGDFLYNLEVQSDKPDCQEREKNQMRAPPGPPTNLPLEVKFLGFLQFSGRAGIFKTQNL